MNKKKIVLLVLITFSLTFPAVQMDSKAHSESVMNEMDGIYLKRHKFMENLGKRMKAFSNFMKRGDGNPLELATMAGEIVAEAPKIPNFFPEHTGMNENEDSEAKPEIWENWDDFIAATDVLTDSARALEVAFESGGLGEIGARIKALGEEGCGGCHEKFRQKRE